MLGSYDSTEIIKSESLIGQTFAVENEGLEKTNQKVKSISSHQKFIYLVDMG